MISEPEAPGRVRPGTDLSGSTVLVVGGTGGVGEGVTHALLHAGATVVGTARTQSKLDDPAARPAHSNLRIRRLDLLAPELVTGNSPLADSVLHYCVERDKGPGPTAPDFL
ncbi:NAD-dependent epimerase/dehydratase family protein [Streptomyces acidicola]|uniref:NAD-dependent epimerase/dehydratase family protein n=1 Tax=Streptomyces acidicola TaxID=2596892 RepID=A0A5N8X2E1_9ACTN|nr:NAD-dependent epimerase/dehydratase family protein [Streptomyces acidicola]MPY53719.1 NAD-dependent epimerase/dehydratase family protein [Streptomyces acidicola]